MSNRQVERAWIEGKPGEANSLTSTGTSLYSYKTEIARVVGDVMYLSERRYSNTTAKHINIAKSRHVNEIIYVESRPGGKLIIP